MGEDREVVDNPRTEPDGAASRPTPGLLLAVGLLCGSVLAAEIAITRIFSAALAYHFTFLVVSLAVCGLGLGGMLQALTPARLWGGLAGKACGLGLSAIASLILFFHVVLAFGWIELWVIALIVLGPFLFAGLFLAEAFQRYSSYSGRLYGADLLGSALAVPGVFVTMSLFDPVDAVLIAGLLSCTVGILLARKRLAPALTALVAGGILASNLATSWLDVPRIEDPDNTDLRHLYRLMSKYPTMEVIDTDWGPFAKTDVVRDTNQPDRLDFFINGTVPTILSRSDPDTGVRAVPNGMLIDLPFAWRRPESVLTIGPGAGLDIVLAKMAGAKVVDGVEVNPSIPKLLERHQDFGGDPYGLPGVDVAVGDGRTYVARADRRYELLILALTKAGTGSVGSSMVECFLYTREAVADYLDVLEDDGVLAFLTDNSTQGARFIHTVLDVMEERGTPPAEAIDHMALVLPPKGRARLSPYKELFLIRAEPFGEEDAKTLRRTANQVGYRAVMIPGLAERAPWDQLRGGATELTAFIEDAERVAREKADSDDLTLQPVGDDSPYFSDLRTSVPPGILPLAFIAFAVLGAFTTVILLRSRSDRVPAGGLGLLGYFGMLGVGFMAVEIPMIQKLILPLGHPTRALTVALFAILLGAATGSSISQRLGRVSLAKTTSLICLLSAVVVGVVLGVVEGFGDAILALDLIPRIVTCGALCFLLGLIMGMPFPLGLRAVGPRHPNLVPWIWGVNGLCSVLGGLLAAAGSKAIGFQGVILLGGAAYVIAAALPRLLANRER